MTVGSEIWVAAIGVVGVVVSAVAAALSAVSIARINSTRADVGHAKDQARAANTAAIEARELARPTGNGYADESRAAWVRIEAQLDNLARRHDRTNMLITKHLADHAEAHLAQHWIDSDDQRL